jgi:hypothetical protein
MAIQRGENMAASGESRWPPLGRNRWPVDTGSIAGRGPVAGRALERRAALTTRRWGASVASVRPRAGRCSIGQRMKHCEGPGTGVRRVRHLACAAVLVWVVTLLGASSAAAVPSVTFKCTPAPQDCSGWYRSNVAIDWTVIPSDAAMTGCQDKTFTTDTAGTNEFCSADDGSATVTVQLKIKVDKTAPVVTGGQPTRTADVGGWYNHAVGVAFSGSDLTSGIHACTATTYGGPDSATASVAGTCTDQAGNVSSPFAYGLKYDETAPTVTGARSERPPDHAGWFTSAVRFAVLGSDATSGIADCPPVDYAGPDSATASVTAGCRDRAGNASSRRFGLRFDATPPSLTALKLAVADRRVSLRWRATGDVRSVQILRSPGFDGERASVVFSGSGARFVDSDVVNRDRYVYEVRARDAAGNTGGRTVVAVPRPHLLDPEPRAVVEAGSRLTLRWTPVRRARYYNVQLFRNGRKVLSAWPAHARYRIRTRWTYRGRRVRLVPGEYRWIVWPGRGARSRGDYGERIGRRTFFVTR